MNAIPAGELRHRIEILRPEVVYNDEGDPAGQKPVLLACWAKRVNKSGSEMTEEHADFSVEQVRFLIRFPAVPLDRKMLVREGGKEYEIDYINDYAGRQYVELWCSRKSSRR